MQKSIDYFPALLSRRNAEAGNQDDYEDEHLRWAVFQQVSIESIETFHYQGCDENEI